MARRRFPKGQSSGMAFERPQPPAGPPPGMVLIRSSRYRTVCKDCGGTIYAGSPIVRCQEGPGFVHAEHFGLR